MKEKIKVPLEEFVTVSPVTADVKASTQDLWKLFEEHDIRHLPIMDGDKVVGLVSNRNMNFLSLLKQEKPLSAGDVMVKEPYTAHLSESLENVCAVMSARKIGSAIILDENEKVCGIFTTTDALNALIEIIRGDV